MSLSLKSILTFLLAVPVAFAQSPPVNQRIHPSSITQSEPVITVSPLNPNVLFASCVTINTSNGFKSEGVYVSSDGGMNWSGSDTCKGELLSNHGGDPGIAIHSSGRLVLTHIGLVFAGVYSHYSTDMGSNWTSAYTVSSDQPEDKGSVEIDNHPTSPYYGRIYLAWVRLIVATPPVSFAFSTNAGTSWSTPVTNINNSPPLRCSGGTIAVAVDGKVYVTWAGMTSAPFTEDFAGFASSSNGGASWTVQQNAFDMNGIFGTLASKGNIRVNGLPQIAIDNSSVPRNGWLYIVTGEKNLAPAGSDPDIVLHRSTNGGQTWSAGIRVNQDPINNGKIQYFPAIAIDSSGGVNVLFYDDRNTASDSSEVYLARSTDGGDSWTERLISDHRFKPKAIAGGASNYQGDHIALLAVGTRLYAMWMDDFSGLYQIWQAIVNVGPNSVSTSPDLPNRFQLSQNFPNPFNPTTSFHFTVASRILTTLKVYDVLGREVSTLVNGTMEAGTHNAEWNASGMPSGIYFCRMTAGSFAQTRKLALLK